MTLCFLWPPKSILLLLPLLLLLLYFFRQNKKAVVFFQSKAKKEQFDMILIGGTAFIPRFLFWTIMRDSIQQVKDVHTIILDSAITGEYTSTLTGFENYPDKLFYFRMFPHKLCYPAFLHYIGLRNQDSILLFQIFCATITTILIYKIGARLISRAGGIICGQIYALWPAQIVYLVFISEENIAILLSLSLILILLDLDEQIHSLNLSALCHAILAGIISGICVYFKDWCLIILISFFVTCILHIQQQTYRQKKMLFFCGLTILLFRSIFKGLIVWKLESLLHATVNMNNFVCYLYVSLHPWNSGGFNPARYKEYFDFVTTNNYDFSVANLQALKATITGVLSSWKRLPWLLTYKLQEGYHDDSHMINNAMLSSPNISNSLFHSFYFLIGKLDFVYWVVLVISVVYTAICNLKELNRHIFWMILTAFGGLLLILLIECEGRYKFCIQPVWLVLSVYGIQHYLLRMNKCQQTKNEIPT